MQVRVKLTLSYTVEIIEDFDLSPERRPTPRGGMASALALSVEIAGSSRAGTNRVAPDGGLYRANHSQVFERLPFLRESHL
jgi:hypothetical protein